MVFIQLTLVRGRTEEKKQDLYRRIVKNLQADAGIRPQDVAVTLTERPRRLVVRRRRGPARRAVTGRADEGQSAATAAGSSSKPKSSA